MSQTWERRTMAWRTSGEAFEAILLLVGSGALAHRSATRRKKGYAQICTDASVLQGESQSEFQRTLRRVRRGYTMFVQNILRHPSSCHDKSASSGPYVLWNGVGREGVGRMMHGSPFPQPALTRSSLELALHAISILGRSLGTASKRHGAGHRRHETSVSWLPGTDSAAPAPLACHWNR